MSTPSDRPSFLRRNRLALLAALVLLVGAGVAGFLWWKQPALPKPGEARYEEYVESFHVGVAALDVGVQEEAEKSLSRAIGLIPQEPAAWANRGLLYLRTTQPAKAAQDLAQAEKLAPDNAGVQKMFGLLELHNGRYAEAATRFRTASAKDSQDVETLFALARSIDKEQKPDADAEYQKLMEQILVVAPNNLHVLAERLRVASRRQDRAAVTDTLTRFRRLAPSWQELTRTQFTEMEKAAAGELGGEVVPLLNFLNVLKAEPDYPRDANEVNPQDSQTGTPLRTFLKLAPVRNTPAAPDSELTFTPEAAEPGRWDAFAPMWLTVDGPPTVVMANEKEVRLESGTLLPSIRLAPDGLVPFDWNNDFLTDLLLVGPGGLRFYQQADGAKFTDVSDKTKLPADILKGDYAAALVADVDLDGDLDVIVARRTGLPLLLRNNFDGTFTPLPIFAGVESARAFAWADLDNDGAPDAAILDARGKLHVFANERSGRLAAWPTAPPDGKFLSLAVADADNDGVFDLVALRDDGALARISTRNKRGAWDIAELSRWQPQAGTEPGTIRLFVADLDNNGVPDLLASGPNGGAAWLGSGNGVFTPLPAGAPRAVVVVDRRGVGKLDLLAAVPDGVSWYRVHSTKNYHWQTIRFRSMALKQADGDNRINSFGIGGEIEARTGTQVVKVPITSPAVHVGLGDRTRADVVRIQWPNGQYQTEFRPAAGQVFSPLQRLKGSCPFLFTWNGERFVFVTDFMWSTPLGLYINAQNRGGFLQSREWVRIRGDQLVPRDGKYEVRAQANLWETHFFDQLSLHVIDHPPGTELFVDERFALGPSEPTYHLTDTPRPVAKATDHLGGDATEIVRNVDGVHLDRCGRGKYQGITNDHWVEVELGDDAPRDGPVWLIAHGWIHPTDSSINFALEQSNNTRPRGLYLEVPDGKGGWKVARDGIGFPAGKNKTVLLRLDGLDGPGVCRRFRIRTNMEIFWDALHVARGRDDAEIRKVELLPTTADLRYRGILEMTQANASSPELPHYDRIASRSQVWRDLIGYHTRFGDVRELLEKIDDRYAILNAGDDIAVTFPVPPAPPSGWKRDFIWSSDGWEKDGDFNTRHGKTVLPLPYHGMTSYETPPGRLIDDPVYRRYPRDWSVYHTRYVTPTEFERGLRVRGK